MVYALRRENIFRRALIDTKNNMGFRTSSLTGGIPAPSEQQETNRKGGSEMRKFRIIIETGIAGGDFEDVFEVDDDATPDEIRDEAKEIFFNYCNYSYHEIKDEEEEQNG